jgi:hypothetical protein
MSREFPVHPLFARDLHRSTGPSDRRLDAAFAANRARRAGTPTQAAPAVEVDEPTATHGWRRGEGFVSTPVEVEAPAAPVVVVSRPRKAPVAAKLPALLPEHDLAANAAEVAGEQPTVEPEPVAAAPVVEAPALAVEPEPVVETAPVAPAEVVAEPVAQPVPAWKAALNGLGLVSLPKVTEPTAAQAPAKKAAERPAPPRMLRCNGCPKKHQFPASEARVPSIDILRAKFEGVPPTEAQLEEIAGCKNTRSEGWYPLKQTLQEIAARIARSEERRRQAEAEYEAGAMDRAIAQGGRVGRLLEKLRDGSSGPKPFASAGPSKAEHKPSTPPAARGGKTFVLGESSADDVLAALRAKAK